MFKLKRLIGTCCVIGSASVAWCAEDAPEQTELPRIAVFGGSFSVIEASSVAKDAWASALKCEVDSYGKSGCGFVAGGAEGKNVNGQVISALKSGKTYEAFILWASGNDISYPIEDTSNGVEKVIKRIRDGAPQAKIVLLNSLDEPFRTDEVRAQLKACAEAQLAVCSQLGVPCLDLFNESGLTAENGRGLVSSDDVHMNAAGYRFITPITTYFLLKTLRRNPATFEVDESASVGNPSYRYTPTSFNNYIWYRFTFRQGSTMANDPYVSLYEFGLFDANGNSQSVGIQEDATKTAAPGTLDPGEMCWDVTGVDCSKGNNPLNLLTDGKKALGANKSSWPFMFVRNSAKPNISKPETWTSFTMRLAEGANPVASYDMCANKAGKPDAQRSLRGWKLEGSADGEIFYELDAKQDQVAEVAGAWFKDGQSFSEGGAHVGYPIVSGVPSDDGAIVLSGGSDTVGVLKNTGGNLSVVKNGAGCWKLGGKQELMGSLTVNEGSLVLDFPSIPYCWYRFTFMQGSTLSNDPYVSLYEFGLVDADGNNQFTGTVENMAKTANPGSLSNGEMCWNVSNMSEVESGTGNKNGLNLLSDGKKVNASGSGWPFMFLRNKTKPAIGNPASWTSFTMRLAEDAKPITSYDMCVNKAGEAKAQRSLRGWKIEGSVDGVTFDELDVHSNEVAQVEGAWFKDGSEFVEGGSHQGYAIPAGGVSVPADVHAFETNIRSVSIAKGSKLIAGCATTLSMLKLKPLSENGTLSGFSFARSGTIDLIDPVEQSTVTFLMENCKDVENLKNWSVKINGVEKNWRVRVMDNSIKIGPRVGLVLVVE